MSNVYFTYKGKRLSFEQIQRRVLRSEKFRSWKRRTGLKKTAVYREEHYTPKWWGDLWAYSAEQIRKLFRKEKGVLKLSNPKDDVRNYESMRIPVSVAERVYRQIAGVNQDTEIFFREKHYPAAYWAKKWSLSSKTVRALMRTFNQPVPKIGKPTNRFVNGREHMRIPETIAERVHQRLTGIKSEEKAS